MHKAVLEVERLNRVVLLEMAEIAVRTIVSVIFNYDI
jgi:hypothetical protein